MSRAQDVKQLDLLFISDWGDRKACVWALGRPLLVMTELQLQFSSSTAADTVHAVVTVDFSYRTAKIFLHLRL